MFARLFVPVLFFDPLRVAQIPQVGIGMVVFGVWPLPVKVSGCVPVIDSRVAPVFLGVGFTVYPNYRGSRDTLVDLGS
jgi:hypothetical protein